MAQLSGARSLELASLVLGLRVVDDVEKGKEETR